MKLMGKEITMENLMAKYREMVEKYATIFCYIKYEEDGYTYHEDITDIQMISIYFEKLLKEEPIEVKFNGLFSL